MVVESKAQGKQVRVALMLDEMSIRKQIKWHINRYRGFVDLGTGTENDDDSPVAKDALVFMVVSITTCWKAPCAYFLIDGLSGVERVNVVKFCTKRLHDIDIKVVSLTCDGPSFHFSMLRELGASINLAKLQASFPHPLDKNVLIHIFLDVCHMLKLVRNTLGEKEILVTAKKSGGDILRLHMNFKERRACDLQIS